MKVDLKAFSERFYKELVRGELKPVLKALEVIRASGTWLEIVWLLIRPERLRAGGARPLALGQGQPGSRGAGALHPLPSAYRLTNLPPTPVATLERAWQVAKAEGLAFPYMGNVPATPGEHGCPACGKQLIRRVGFQVAREHPQGGHCRSARASFPACGADLAQVCSKRCSTRILTPIEISTETREDLHAPARHRSPRGFRAASRPRSPRRSRLPMTKLGKPRP